MNLIIEYIKLIKVPKIPDDLFLRRLNVIYREFSKFDSLKEINQEAITTAKEFADIVIKFLKKELISNTEAQTKSEIFSIRTRYKCLSAL